jgi:hypothetical protein
MAHRLYTRRSAHSSSCPGRRFDYWMDSGVLYTIIMGVLLQSAHQLPILLRIEMLLIAKGLSLQVSKN